MNFCFIANSVSSHKSLSGGDKIFIEFAREWSKEHNITLFCCREGQSISLNNKLKLDIKVISSFDFEKLGLFVSYFLRIFKALFSLPKIRPKTIIYSTSDFLTDVIPAVKLLLKTKESKWIAGLYLIVPCPIKSYPLSPSKWIYYLSQIISLMLMKRYASLIFVLNKEDSAYLTRKFKIASSKIQVINAGVDINLIETVKAQAIAYDASFIGRYHSQKGIFDLINAWEIVVHAKPKAKLAIIGWGTPPWVKKIKTMLFEKKLEENISLLGFLDREEKFKALKSSKLFLFPSNHESYGIVALEAMACGLPVIAYALEVLQEVYADNLNYVTKDDIKAFAQKTLAFLSNENLLNLKAKQAKAYSQNFNWPNISKTILEEALPKL